MWKLYSTNSLLDCASCTDVPLGQQGVNTGIHTVGLVCLSMNICNGNSVELPLSKDTFGYQVLWKPVTSFAAFELPRSPHPATWETECCAS